MIIPGARDTLYDLRAAKPGDLLPVGRFFALFKNPGVVANLFKPTMAPDAAVFLERDTLCLIIGVINERDKNPQGLRGVFLLTPKHGVRWLPL